MSELEPRLESKERGEYEQSYVHMAVICRLEMV